VPCSGKSSHTCQKYCSSFFLVQLIREMNSTPFFETLPRHLFRRNGRETSSRCENQQRAKKARESCCRDASISDSIVLMTTYNVTPSQRIVTKQPSKKKLPHQTSKGIPLTVNGHVQKKRSVSFTDFTYKHPLYTQPETSRSKYKYRYKGNSVSDGQLRVRKRACCWVTLVGGRFVRQANNRVFPAPCLQGHSSNI